MTDTHLDGNAIGGLLRELFGTEMTHQRGCCDGCGAIGALGAALVFVNAPGHVVRCSNCLAVLMVAVAFPTGARVTLVGLRWLELQSDLRSSEGLNESID